MLNYKAIVKSEQIFNKSVSEKVQQLSTDIEKAEDESEMYKIVTDFYRTYGVGRFGLNKANLQSKSQYENTRQSR
ncbi:MAG: hypothetical protein ACLTAS_02940 [Butyribacter sp.]